MAQSPDPFYVFTGISSSRIMELLKTALEQRGELQERLLEPLTRHPMESLTTFLVGTSVAFYLAERHVNPKINTFVDALYYISTCLSVGYADIFAQTQKGKMIATLVMALGPALSGNALDQPGQAGAASVAGQEKIVQRLDAILEELKKGPQPGESAS